MTDKKYVSDNWVDIEVFSVSKLYDLILNEGEVLIHGPVGNIPSLPDIPVHRILCVDGNGAIGVAFDLEQVSETPHFDLEDTEMIWMILRGTLNVVEDVGIAFPPGYRPEAIISEPEIVHSYIGPTLKFQTNQETP